MNLEKMPIGKRSKLSYNARYKRARTQGRAYKGMVNVLTRTKPRKLTGVAPLNQIVRRVNNMYRMIETKEITWKLESTRAPLVQYFTPHNNLFVWLQNPLQVSQGAADNMQEGNQVNRIGDRITIKGMMMTMFMENAVARPRVFYRVMLVRMAKGDTLDRSTFFKNNCSNKMIDQVNTERFSIIGQKTFTITASGAQVTTSNTATGEPTDSSRGSIGTKVIKIWVPGSKFGPNGNIQFENGSYQIKFFDYRWVILSYDWFGTPQDVNNVGFLNCMYTKTYFKDA